MSLANKRQIQKIKTPNCLFQSSRLSVTKFCHHTGILIMVFVQKGCEEIVLYKFIRLFICIELFLYICIEIYICIFVQIYISICICIYVYIYLSCIQIYICIYVQKSFYTYESYTHASPSRKSTNYHLFSVAQILL